MLVHCYKDNTSQYYNIFIYLIPSNNNISIKINFTTAYHN